MPRLRRRRALHLERSTLALAVAALSALGGVLVTEFGQVWHRGSAPGPVEADHILDAAATAVVEAGEVARAGLRESPERETALLNLFLSFVFAFGLARVSTWTIRRRGRWGPFRNVKVGRRHVHHFLPGMAVALLAGGIAIVTDDEQIEPWLALPFGAGLGLTLDESALLLELDDVYWTEEGVLSLQVALTATALLGGAVLARRVGRRGREDVLEPATPSPRP